MSTNKVVKLQKFAPNLSSKWCTAFGIFKIWITARIPHIFESSLLYIVEAN